MVPAGEAGHVDGAAGHDGGDDRADAKDLGEAGAECPDRDGQALAGVAYLGVDAAQVLDEAGGELVAGVLDGSTHVTETINRHVIAPAIRGGAAVMDDIFGAESAPEVSAG